MSDKPTIPAPPIDEASLPEMVREELKRLRKERDEARRWVARAQRQIHDLHAELDRLKARHGHF